MIILPLLCVSLSNGLRSSCASFQASPYASLTGHTLLSIAFQDLEKLISRRYYSLLSYRIFSSRKPRGEQQHHPEKGAAEVASTGQLTYPIRLEARSGVCEFTCEPRNSSLIDGLPPHKNAWGNSQAAAPPILPHWQVAPHNPALESQGGTVNDKTYNFLNSKGDIIQDLNGITPHQSSVGTDVYIGQKSAMQDRNATESTTGTRTSPLWRSYRKPANVPVIDRLSMDTIAAGVPLTPKRTSRFTSRLKPFSLSLWRPHTDSPRDLDTNDSCHGATMARVVRSGNSVGLRRTHSEDPSALQVLLLLASAAKF